jgi:hypothetical protein
MKRRIGGYYWEINVRLLWIRQIQVKIVVMISIIDWLIRLPFRTLFIFKSFDFVPCQEKKECNRFPQRNLNKTKVSDVRFTSARSIVHCSKSRRRQLCAKVVGKLGDQSTWCIPSDYCVTGCSSIGSSYFSFQTIASPSKLCSHWRAHLRVCVYMWLIYLLRRNPQHTLLEALLLSPRSTATAQLCTRTGLRRWRGGLHGPEQSSETSLDGRRWCC